MKGNFKFEHGIGWLIWVAIIFSLCIGIFFFGVYGHLVNLLGAYGVEINDDIRHAIFWLLVSVIAISALRGAKVEIKLAK